MRIATGVAQGIAFAADLPVIPVSSLAAMAQSVEHGYVYSAIDARMNEGPFRIATFTRNEKVGETLNETLQVLKKYNAI